MKRTASDAKLTSPDLKRRRYTIPPRNKQQGFFLKFLNIAKGWYSACIAYWFGPVPHPVRLAEPTPPSPQFIRSISPLIPPAPVNIVPAFNQHQRGLKTQEWINKLIQIDGIYESDAKQLINNERLGSGILNIFFEKLQAQHADVFCLDSSFITLKNFFENIKNRPKYLAKLKNNLNHIQTILWPICTGKPNQPKLTDHWYLVILHKIPSGSYNFYWLDGFNHTSLRYLEDAKKLLSALYPNKGADELIHAARCVHIPKQQNDVDCGVVACYWALQFLQGCDLKEISKEMAVDYTAFRYTMAEIISDGKAANKILK